MSDKTFLAFDSKAGFAPIELANVPDWTRVILSCTDSCEMDEHLAKQGATCTETYGVGAEGIDLWHIEDEWLAVYWTGNTVTMRIIIRGVVDYANFQATWLCHMARKLMAADQYWEWKKMLEHALDGGSYKYH